MIEALAVLIALIVAWRLITPVLEWFGGLVLYLILSPWLPRLTVSDIIRRMRKC